MKKIEAIIKPFKMEAVKDAQTLLANWQLFKTQALPALNQELQGKGLPVIAVPK